MRIDDSSQTRYTSFGRCKISITCCAKGGKPVLKIAICDDAVSELSNIVSILDAYRERNPSRDAFTYTTFDNPFALLAAVEGSNAYDMILLDIVMPGMSGIDAAREIRTRDKAVKIIFLTTSPEFAVDSYAVDAFYYALKPIRKDKLFPILDKACADIRKQDESGILVKCKTGLTRIPLHMLQYTEISGRTISYHLINGTVLEEIGAMAKLEQVLLAYPQFAKPHRAFIVNLDCIDILTLREVKLNSNAAVPVARGIYADFKARYLARVFQRGRDNICSLR